MYILTVNYMNPHLPQASKYVEESVGTPQFKHAMRIYSDLLKPEGSTNTLTLRELREMQLPELKARLTVRDRQEAVTHFEALEAVQIAQVIQEINELILDALKPETVQKIKGMTTNQIFMRIEDTLNMAGEQALNKHEARLIQLLREGLQERIDDLNRQKAEWEARGIPVEDVPKHLRLLEHIAEISQYLK